jgi:hypothetical protein
VDLLALYESRFVTSFVALNLCCRGILWKQPGQHNSYHGAQQRADHVEPGLAQRGAKPWLMDERRGDTSPIRVIELKPRIAGLRPVLIRMPFAFWNALAGVAEMLPQPPLTRNQVELMQIDTTASESLPGFRALRISPRSLEDELQAMLRQNKPRVLLS